MIVVRVKRHCGEDGRALGPHRIQLIRIEAQEFQDRGSNLSRLHKGVNRLGMEVRVRDQQHYVGIIPCVAAMFGLLIGCCPAMTGALSLS